MRWIFRIFLLAVGVVFSAGQAFSDSAVREEKLLLPIQIGTRIEKIEVLIVHPIDGMKLPIALIVNGSATSPSAPRADWLAHIAHDFAHRGWLAASIVWPGYGHSTGTFANNAGNCVTPDVAQFLDAHGNELAAALVALRKRPDVDPSVALGIGISIGGASMLNLAAHVDRPLTAVINVSGGVYHYTKVGNADPECPLYQDDLIRNITKFGTGNPTPTLWLYAANDPFFGPDLAKRMVTGYRSQGGQADFVLLPPFGTDGHTLYKLQANALLEPSIDDFLRHNHLPAMDDKAMMPLLSRLAPADRSSAESYLQSVTEKAMAMSGDASGTYWFYGARSIEAARQQALNTCRKATGKQCRLVAENMHLVDGWEEALPKPGQ